MTTTVMALVMAVALFALGRWGRKNAAILVPSTLSADGREKKERAMRRGAMACQLAAMWLLVLGIAEFAYWAVH